MRADHLLIGCLLAVSLRLGMFSRLWKAFCSSWVPGMLTVAGLALCSFADMHYGSGFRDSIGFIVAPLLSALFIVSAIAFQGAACGGRLTGIGCDTWAGFRTQSTSINN